jgi:arylsulfatase A
MQRRTFLRAVAGAPGAGPPASSSDRPLNVLFVLTDDLGWRDTAPFDNTFTDTPNLTRLAGQSARFTNACAACCVCSPTRASILTGKYPARLHLTDWIPVRRHR